MAFNFVSLICSVLLWTIVFAEDNRKNHRAERRQDDSFLFFGGWRPVKSGNKYYQSSASSPFHQILQALPTNFDHAASQYAQAMSSQYHKDIYNFYPKPVIKSKPKKNTPVYMEKYRPQRQPQNKYPRGGQNHQMQFLDIPGIDLKHIQDLQELLLHAKELPLSHFPQINLPIEHSKPLNLLEVSLQSLQQGNQNYGFPRNNGFNRMKKIPQGSMSNYNQARHRGRAHVRPPVHFDYIAFPKNHQILPQVLPKEVEITPMKLQHPIHSIGDVDLKKFQIVEVPVPEIASYVNPSQGTNYEKAPSQPNHQEYKSSNQNSFPNNFPSMSYFAHETEQPRKHQEPQQQKSSLVHQQPTLEAELIKLNEEELKHLLSGLQMLHKNPHEILKHFPFDQIGNLQDIQFLLPQAAAGYSQESSAGYESGKSVQKNVAYGSAEQYSVQSDTSSYQPKSSPKYTFSSNSYQSDNQEGQSYGHSSEYGGEQPSPRDIGGGYGGNSYQQEDSHPGYDQGSNNQDSKGGYSSGNEHQYSQQGSQSHGGSYGQGGQSFIQVLTPPAGEDGYRREPVLAVEIQQGQSIEEAIKSIDRETLKKLGSHGKNGIEIEVVEIPVDEYGSESKKTETVVSAGNSTLPLKPKKTSTKS